jgi:lactate 2-monooxygenase
MWGLAMGGEAGVEHVIKCMRADLELNMGLAGIKDMKDVNKDVLIHAPSPKL